MPAADAIPASVPADDALFACPDALGMMMSASTRPLADGGWAERRQWNVHLAESATCRARRAFSATCQYLYRAFVSLRASRKVAGRFRRAKHEVLPTYRKHTAAPSC